MSAIFRVCALLIFAFTAYDFAKTYYEYYVAFNSYSNNIQKLKQNTLTGMFFHDPVIGRMPHDNFMFALLLFCVNILIYTLVKLTICIIFTRCII